MAFRKIEAGLVQSSIDNFIGKKGTIFYDNDDGALRLSDGQTPGGNLLSGGAGGDYALPTASTTVKGGVKIDGSTITIANQVISVGTVPYSSLSGTPTIPTNNNELTNGAAYITSAALSGLATETYVTTRGYLTTVAYADVTGKPTLFSGSYTDLTDKPNIPSLTGYATETFVTTRGYLTSVGTISYNDLSNKPTLFDGAYASLSGKPTLFSGSYTDLTNKPTIYSSAYIGTTSLDFTRSSASQTLNGVSIDGNAATATSATSAGTLTTARNINGVSFNGSAAINIPTLTDGTNNLKIVAVPTALTGAAGDAVGNIAFDGTSIYYCTAAYVPNTYTGTFTISQSANPSFELQLSNNWQPGTSLSVLAGWTVTFNNGSGNITRTISFVNSWSNSQPNGYWIVTLSSSWTGTSYIGDSFTLNPGTALPNIWKKVPWIVSGLTTTGTGAISSLTAESFDTDQIRIVGNRIATSVTNANLELEPNGTGNITISTGTVVGTQTTQNIFNTTATTVNFAGAATTLAMGAATGTLTINNPTIATGSSGTLTLFNTGATTVTAFGAATTINLGYTNSVAFSNTFNIATNAQAFSTKTVNIGTGSSADGSTYINIGSTLGQSYVTVNGTLTATLTGNASTATKLATARAINGVNFDGSAAITVTAEAGTLSGSTLASGVTASSLTSVGTLTGVTSNAATAFSAGDSAISNVALSVPRDAAIRDRTNGASVIFFDVSNGGTTNGGFEFRSSSAFTKVLEMNTTAFNVNTNAVVTARTASLARLAWNSAMGTELTVDNMRFRITNSGLAGIFPQVIGNGSARNLAWTVVAARSGSAVTQAGSTGAIVASDAWTTLYSLGGMDSSGDTFTATLQDKGAGTIYRVTFMRSDSGGDGFNIIAERLL